MHASYANEIPVVGQPLPWFIRMEIHRLVRDGCSIISVDQAGGQWQIGYRDGSQSLYQMVRNRDLSEIGGDAA